MTTPKLKVIKVPRTDPLKDVPINFKPFENLHLELIEAKPKLKLGLPLIPRSQPKLRPTPPISKEPEVLTIPIRDTPRHKEHKKEREKESESKEKKKKSSPKEEKKRDVKHKKRDEIDDIMDELGENSSVEKPRKKKKPEKESTSEDKEAKQASSQGEEEEEEEEEVEEEEEEVEDDPYAGLTPEERMAREKEEYIWRFRILKKQYGNNPSVPIPDWNEHSDLNMMKTSYERTIKELYLDDAVETYRTYLIGGWMAMEYVCVQLMGIDIRGFTLQQLKMMYKYDRMLIELGEKSYTRWATNLPVEIRLMGLILFQAAIFYLGKIVAESYGTGAADLFRGFTGQPPPQNVPQSSTAEEEPPARKMRGPRVKADDIRKNTNPPPNSSTAK